MDGLCPGEHDLCGHEGALPVVIDNQPACCRCSGIRLSIDRKTCGAEDELHSGGRCWTCVLGNVVDDLLTDPATESIANDLIPLAAALKSMKRANSGLTWIRQEHVTAFFRNLAVAPKSPMKPSTNCPTHGPENTSGDSSPNTGYSPDGTNSGCATTTGPQEPSNV